VQVLLNGSAIQHPDERGQPIIDDTVLIIFHAHPEDRELRLPDKKWGPSWIRVFDTDRGFPKQADGEKLSAGHRIHVIQRSLWVMRRGG
jgi:glycogen operon protein